MPLVLANVIDGCRGGQGWVSWPRYCYRPAMWEDGLASIFSHHRPPIAIGLEMDHNGDSPRSGPLENIAQAAIAIAATVPHLQALIAQQRFLGIDTATGQELDELLAFLLACAEQMQAEITTYRES